VLDRLPDPADPDHHFVIDPAKADFYAMGVYRWLGVGDAAQEYAQRTRAYCERPDGTIRSPMRRSEALLTLGAVAARRGELDAAVAYGLAGLGDPRKCMPSLLTSAADLDAAPRRASDRAGRRSLARRARQRPGTAGARGLIAGQSVLVTDRTVAFVVAAVSGCVPNGVPHVAGHGDEIGSAPLRLSGLVVVRHDVHEHMCSSIAIEHLVDLHPAVVAGELDRASVIVDQNPHTVREDDSLRLPVRALCHVRLHIVEPPRTGTSPRYDDPASGGRNRGNSATRVKSVAVLTLVCEVPVARSANADRPRRR